MNFYVKLFFLLVEILNLSFPVACSHRQNGRNDETTPEEEGPTTLKPSQACDLPKLDCLKEHYTTKDLFITDEKSLFDILNKLSNFHGYPASEPISKEPDSSTVIEAKVLRENGEWTNWAICPGGRFVEGCYSIGWLENYGALMFHVFCLCRTPGGNEKDSRIDLTAVPSEPIPDEFNLIKKCSGTVVGFELKVSQDFGIHNFSTYCSIDGEKVDEKLTGRISIVNTSPVFCDKYQAMCGMQAKMVKDDSIQNLRIKCCQVEDPLKDCIPTELSVHIGTCDNSNSSQASRCQYQVKIGLSISHNEIGEKALLFYSSIGYDFFSISEPMKDKIVSKLQGNISSEYPWHEISCKVEEFETNSLKILCLQPHEKVEIYQIVGSCGYFQVRTNRLMKITKVGEGEPSEPEYWYV